MGLRHAQESAKSERERTVQACKDLDCDVPIDCPFCGYQAKRPRTMYGRGLHTQCGLSRCGGNEMWFELHIWNGRNGWETRFYDDTVSSHGH